MRRPFCRLSTTYEFNLALIIAVGISGYRLMYRCDSCYLKSIV